MAEIRHATAAILAFSLADRLVHGAHLPDVPVSRHTDVNLAQVGDMLLGEL